MFSIWKNLKSLFQIKRVIQVTCMLIFDHIYRILDHFFSKLPLREKCPYLELFWSAFSRIWTEYGEIRSIRSECRKMRTRITSNTNTFYAVSSPLCYSLGSYKQPMAKKSFFTISQVWLY